MKKTYPRKQFQFFDFVLKMKTVIKHTLIYQEVYEIDFEDGADAEEEKEEEEERNDYYHAVPFPGVKSVSNQKNESSISLEKSKKSKSKSSLQNVEICRKLHLAYVLKIEKDSLKCVYCRKIILKNPMFESKNVKTREINRFDCRQTGPQKYPSQTYICLT